MSEKQKKRLEQKPKHSFGFLLQAFLLNYFSSLNYDGILGHLTS